LTSGRVSNPLQRGLDFVADFIDRTTDDYEHTGIRSVARSLIQCSVNEI